MSSSEPVDQPRPFRARDYLAPRYWPTWLGLGLLRASTRLSYPAMLRLGSGIGWLLYRLMRTRRHIALTNLRLCFPELSEAQREALARENFAATAIALFEGAISWWGDDGRLRALHQVEGLEHLQAARAQGRGVILLGAHYTTLELSGRFLSFHSDDIAPIYKPARNPLFEALMATSRRRLFDTLLPSKEMRGILRALKAGKVIWYAPDQDFGRRQAVFAPFFDVATASLTTTARLARLSGAPVLPFYSERLPGEQGYLIRVLPALENYPSGEDVADAARINAVIEAQVRRVPAQYLWVHKRFKTRPEGEPGVY